MTQKDIFEDKELILALENFSNTQEKLIREFQKQYHPIDNDIGQVKKPKTGRFTAIGQEWKFCKHGIGISFENISSGATIDAHDGIRINKRIFDAWRLSIFFESIGITELLWKSNSFFADDDDSIEKLL